MHKDLPGNRRPSEKTNKCLSSSYCNILLQRHYTCPQINPLDLDQNTQEDAPNHICKLDRQTLDLIGIENQMDLSQVDQDDYVQCSLS